MQRGAAKLQRAAARGRLEAAGAEQSFEVFAARAAELQLGAVVEGDDVFAVEELPQLADAFEVDDRRAVDAGELFGVEARLHLVHRLAQQVALAPDVELDVVVLGGDVVDLVRLQEGDAARRLDEQACQVLRMCGDARALAPFEQGDEAPAEVFDVAPPDLPLGLGERLLEARVVANRRGAGTFFPRATGFRLNYRPGQRPAKEISSCPA